MTIQYKGYTIKEDWSNPFSNKPMYKFFPTDEGEQDDADGDSEGYKYCGNGRWESSLESAKDEITVLVLEKKGPFEVRVNGKVHEFWDFIIAVQAAIKCNGELLTPIHSI